MAKNKRIKESSIVLNIKGYLAGTKKSSVRKKTKKDTPWYLKSLGQLKEEVVKEFANLKEATADEIKARKLELEREMLRARDAFQKDPMDHRKEMTMNSTERAYKNFVSLSPEEQSSYQKFAVNPQQTRDIETKQASKDVSPSKLRKDINPEVLQFITQIDPEDLKVIDRGATDSIFSILDKYIGRKPTREKEYALIKDFVENVFYKEYGGRVGSYIKAQSKNWRNMRLSDIYDKELQNAVMDEIVENNVKLKSSIGSFSDWTQLSKDTQSKIKDYHEKFNDKIRHVIRKEFSKVQLPKMAVSANVKRTQRLNPYTKEKQLSDQEQENSAAADLPLDIGKKK